MRTDRIWTKEFIILLFSNFLAALIFYLLMTSMSVYAVEQFSTTKGLAGLASSIFVIGAIISRAMAGKYMDRIGRKKLILIGLILASTAMTIYLIAFNIIALLTIRFVHGITCGFFSTVISTAAVAILPTHRRGEGNAFFLLSITVSTAVGPFLANYLVYRFSYSVLFIFCIICSVVPILCISFVKIVEADKTAVEKEKAIDHKFGFAGFFEKKALPASIIVFLASVFYASVLSLLNVYSVESGLGQAS